MKVTFLLKDNRAYESRADTYGKEHVEKMLTSIENDFEMRVEGEYMCKGSEVRAIILKF
ncbi:hypothetical protein M3629_17510 [Paenibacillus polysaccharolyticus]|uniref:hypothetical protein n=1 Tax=Paenibacillus polysaccharolyticus TaxID=582692 RepID=UPI00203F514C|nr:hypothetical protein [Paenibacillus polysaccharolyticus]MCM3134590.1 hypothetical protein [Paenibacillus polysaccharolyticus]